MTDSRPGPDPLDRLPHTGPARLPDRVVHLERGERVIAEKALLAGDPCLNEDGILPPVLLIELMAQTGGLLLPEEDRHPGRVTMLAGIQRMSFGDAARAGQTVRVECSLTRRLGSVWMIAGRGRAGDRDLGEGTILIGRREDP